MTASIPKKLLQQLLKAVAMAGTTITGPSTTARAASEATARSMIREVAVIITRSQENKMSRATGESQLSLPPSAPAPSPPTT